MISKIHVVFIRSATTRKGEAFFMFLFAIIFYLFLVMETKEKDVFFSARNPRYLSGILSSFKISFLMFMFIYIS